MRPSTSLVLLTCLNLAACESGTTSHQPAVSSTVPSSAPVEPNPMSPPATSPTHDLMPSTPVNRARFAEGSNRYAFQTWHSWPADNQVFAPGSISLAMAMTWAGAQENTASEIAEVFHFDGQTHPGATGLLAEYRAPDSPLAVANRLFGEQTYTFLPDFLSLMSEGYLAPLESLDFKTNAIGARSHINQWVAAQTRERITDLLTPLSVTPRTRLVLVNALSFLAAWKTPFTEQATQERRFTNGAGHIQVPMMFAQRSFKHAEIDGVRVVELPYAGDRFSMVFVLPEQSQGLAALEQGLTPERWQAWNQAMVSEHGSVRIPRFRVVPEGSISLRRSLSSMGIEDAFEQQQANFHGMSQPTRIEDELYIGDVIHQAFIQVDEHGTEAAAATAVAMFGTGGQPPEPSFSFEANEPFLFFLKDQRTGLILFMGRVTEPDSA